MHCIHLSYLRVPGLFPLSIPEMAEPASKKTSACPGILGRRAKDCSLETVSVSCSSVLPNRAMGTVTRRRTVQRLLGVGRRGRWRSLPIRGRKIQQVLTPPSRPHRLDIATISFIFFDFLDLPDWPMPKSESLVGLLY